MKRLAGRSVLIFLDTRAGEALCLRHALSMERLSATLKPNVVEVRRGPLLDNRGSTVDALGEPGRIVLDLVAWDTFFGLGQDVYYLVFHEMLRAAGYDDDNYAVSRDLYPFPFYLKAATRVRPVDENTSGLPYWDRIMHLTQRCATLTHKAEEIQIEAIVPDLKQLSGILQELAEKACLSPEKDFEPAFRRRLDRVENILNMAARILPHFTG
jgi:hypothetical protein